VVRLLPFAVVRLGWCTNWCTSPSTRNEVKICLLMGFAPLGYFEFGIYLLVPRSILLSLIMERAINLKSYDTY
jgi:hypothetical protein